MMSDEAPAHGLTTIDVDQTVAMFATARHGPVGMSPAGLAGVASATLGTLLGHRVPVLYARQEHTTLTFSYSASQPLVPGAHLVGRCDGLMTAERGVGLVVRTADCLPVALVGGGVAAMLHAGWRGLAADILGSATSRLATEYGVSEGELAAVIGVGIGPCHYQVGREVIEALSKPTVTNHGWQQSGRVDLAAWASGRLAALGVPKRAIRVLAGCTACSGEHHSFRRDGATAGRQWSAVVLRSA
jgi:YfiH family protein